MSLSVPASLHTNENAAEISTQNVPNMQVAVVKCSLELDSIKVPTLSLQPQAGWTLVPALDGGAFSTWNTGDVFDGGAFSPWDGGDSFFGGYIDFIPPNISIQMVLLH